MSIEHLLHAEIENRLQQLGGMDPGSDEYKSTIDGTAKLIDRAIEIDKFNNECDEKVKSREIETKDRLTKNIISGAGIIIPTAVTIWGTLKSLKFEETGTVTTAIGRGFINKLLPKR